MRLKSKVFAVIGIFLLSILMSSCKSMSTTAKGGVIGAGTGAVIGGLIGKKSGNTATGAILGAAIGGAGGAVIGKVMDKQKKKIEEELGEDAEVERVGEGIRVRFDSGILFKVGSAHLSETAKKDLRKLANTLTEYPDTDVLVEGHTDSSGSEEMNQGLSERRASAVANYIHLENISRSRLLTRGYGETQPIADNATAEGKMQNRRVEIAITANEKMKKDAEEGKLSEN